MIAFASISATRKILNSQSKCAVLCYGAQFQAKLIYFPELKLNYSQHVKGPYALAGYTKFRFIIHLNLRISSVSDARFTDTRQIN